MIGTALSLLITAFLAFGAVVLLTGAVAVAATLGLWLFPQSRFLNRLWTSAMALLKAEDILACAFWLAPLYLIGLASRPSGRQMISSYVGGAASAGYQWARVAAVCIDLGAMMFGALPNHCHRCWLAYRGLDA